MPFISDSLLIFFFFTFLSLLLFETLLLQKSGAAGAPSAPLFCEPCETSLKAIWININSLVKKKKEKKKKNSKAAHARRPVLICKYPQ